MHEENNNITLMKLKKDVEYLTKQNNILLNDIDFLKKIIISEHVEKSSKNLCPICNNLSIFGSYGVNKRNNARCPHCGSLERHRLVYLFFNKKYDNLLNKEKINFLHFAPEGVLYNIFNNMKNIDYFPVDLDPEYYESQGLKIRDKVNMEYIQYTDNTFDIIYNSHVLEHVPNDIQAMSELHRVLKQDGICVIMVPMSKNAKTFEDPKYNTPELRLKYFGQEDHVRIYGKDFKNRLVSVGFNVKEVTLWDIIESNEYKQLYRLPQDIIYVCTKK